MSLSYIPHQLVHAHLPCPPSIPDSIPEHHIPSDRPSPEYDTDDLFYEHALAFSYNAELNVIARVTHNGYTLELRAFDTVYQPTLSTKQDDNGSETLRIVFPERITSLSGDCIIVSEMDGRVYILVYTEDNVLYRLNFPLRQAQMGLGSRFSFTTRGNDDWVEEFEVPEDVVAACGGVGVWHVVDELNVVLGGADGGIVRLERDHRGLDGSWSAHHHRVSSRFRLPSLFSSAGSDEQVISFAKFVVDEDTVLLYSLSRDRKLRVWNAFTGSLLKSTDAKITSSSRDLAVRDGQTPPSSSQSTPLIDTIDVPLIRILPHPSPSSKVSHLLVVFTSTPRNPSSPGAFLVYRVGRGYGGPGDMSLAGDKFCSSSSVGSEIRGFEVLPPVKDDGIDSGWRLWVAWDRKGTIACESIIMDDVFQFTSVYTSSTSHAPTGLLHDWQRASQDDRVGTFDPAYFDNLLSLDPPDPTQPYENSDISRVFVEHLFYPGRFSILGLTTALEEYIAQLPRDKAYMEMSQSFASLARKYEHIVGCDLEMEMNTQTGAPEVQEFRSKLKLQWLGIWARVRNLDAGSRWPVGTLTMDDKMAVVTREGYTVPLPQDVCSVINDFGHLGDTAEGFMALPETALRRSYPALTDSTMRSGAASISAAGTHIATVLSKIDHEEQNGTVLEALVDTLNGLVARPYTEGIEGAAVGMWEDFLAPYLDEEEQTSIRRLLSECQDALHGLGQIVDLLGSFDTPLSGEIDENLRLSGIGNALLAENIAMTLRARYILSRNALLVAVFQFTDSIDIDGKTQESEEYIRLLYRVFTTYQRYRPLNFISEQAADEASRNQTGRDATLRVRAESHRLDADGHETTYSLLHSILAGSLSQDVSDSPSGEIFVASAAFIETSLSLEAGAWDNAPLQKDVKMAYDVLEDGHPTLAGMITTFYPPSPGMFYVKARAYLDIGEIDEATSHFERAAAGCHARSLESLIPRSGGTDGLKEYYRHVTRLFEERGLEEPIVRFGNLALQSTRPDDPEVKDIWTKVFLATTSIGEYKQAYVTLTSTPYTDLKQDFLGQLISAMCEANQVGQLLEFGFVGFQKEVEAQLSFKARHSDPLRPPHYHQVLYSWHVTRGDYRSAADVMYQQAKRLEGSRRTKEFSTYDVTVKQASSLLAAINALSLLDKRQAWLANPVSAAAPTHRATKRRRVTSYIPEEEFAKGKNILEIITLSDIQAEYTSVLGRLQLHSEMPDLLEHGQLSIEPNELVGLFVQRGKFDEAQASASSLHVDMTDLFKALADRCVRLSRYSQNTISESPSTAWLYRSPVTSHLQGPPPALALRYLHNALIRHDSRKTNWRYRQVVADQMFSMNNDAKGGWRMPVWLVEWEMERDPEAWIGRALSYGWVSEALDWSLQWLRSATPPELLDKRADATYTPWNLFDRVVAATVDEPEKDDEGVQKKTEALRKEMKRRLEGMSKIRLGRS